jgi:cation diffusion facilitator family transporter
MHAQAIDAYRHEHVFLGEHHAKNERKTWLVIAICGAMMVAEIGGGALFGSMALIADGLHMSTHAGALLIAALAYTYSRRHARDARFTFGTGKFGDLAGYTSAIALAMIALLIGYESIERLLHPVRIAFDEAIPVACVGLGVNLLSAWLLKDDHDHHHAHAHDDDHVHDHDDHDHHVHDDHHHGSDLNLRAAYVHVLADAAVSVFAITGLVAGRELGWVWMDPVMGIAGAIVISNWSWGLVRAAAAVLLDARASESLAAEIAERLETGGDRISDLHLWRVGPGHNAAIISLVTHAPRPPAFYKDRLAALTGLSHVTVEVETCEGPHAAAA